MRFPATWGSGVDYTTMSERTPVIIVNESPTIRPVVWHEPPPIVSMPELTSGFRIVDEIRARRGLVTRAAINEALKPNLAGLADAAVVPGLDEVVARIAEAIREEQRIHIFGDYDCDGVTSTAILISALRSAHANPEQILWSLPTRSDGYGLRDIYLDQIAACEPELLITVDCGSNDRDSIEAMRAAGIDVVVIDHHQLSATLPEAVLFANPQRDPEHATTSLVGAGLAWLTVRKLARSGALGPTGETVLEKTLELAAIGTIGDIAPLTGLNRAIVIEGGKVLRKGPRLGLRTLLRVLRLEAEAMTAEAVSYRLVPILNAAGRMAAADVALDLLLTTSFDQAQELVDHLYDLNSKRRVATDDALAGAHAQIELMGREHSVLIVVDPRWHAGVAGPLASKLVEEYGKPVIVLTCVPGVEQPDDLLFGSARSVRSDGKEWDIARALLECREILEHNGGHTMAAGLTVRRGKLGELWQRLERSFVTTGIATPIPRDLQIDADIGADPVRMDLALQLNQLGPFGAGNSRPILRWRGVRVGHCWSFGKDNSHARVLLQRGQLELSASKFGAFEELNAIGAHHPIDVLIKLDVEMYKGQRQLRAQIEDWRPAD